jgi:hypothetical protein
MDRLALLTDVLDALHLVVPTATLAHQLGANHHTIDHIAVPSGWIVTAACRIPANGLSDHDAYVVDVDDE